jgi:uncharacterized delta-60 repeat protein
MLSRNAPAICAIAVLLAAAQSASAQVQAVWVRRYDSGGWQEDRAAGLALDSAGNVYVTGHAPGTAGDNDFVTVRYRSAGSREWVQRLDGPNHSEDRPAAIAVGPDGSIYVAGSSNYFSRHSDYTTVKYSPAGVEQWVRRHNASDSATDVATTLAVAATGDIVVSGYSGSYPDYDILTIRYNSAGDTVWTRRYAGPGGGVDRPWAMATDGTGNVYVCGQSCASVGSPDSSDMLTLKYGSDGTELWAVRWAGPRGGPDAALGIAVDSTGNVHVCGFTDAAAGGSADFVTLKYNAVGDTVWSRTLNGPGNASDTARAIALDRFGNVCVAGACRGESSGQDYATVRYDSDGASQWVRYYDHELGDDAVSAVAVDREGSVYVTGRSQGSLGGIDFLTVKYNAGGDSLWTARYDDDQGFDAAAAIAVDTAGYVHVAGTSWNGYSQEDYATVKYQQSSGIEGERQVRDGLDVAARIVITRNWFFLPPSAVSNPRSVVPLLDISGRVASGLRTGTNDVSRLSPGVYFLQPGRDGRSLKVIVQH